MAEWQPEPAFLRALRKLDADEADVIVTPAPEVAEWAREHGYRVSRGKEVEGMATYEIWPRDSGTLGP